MRLIYPAMLLLLAATPALAQAAAEQTNLQELFNGTVVPIAGLLIIGGMGWLFELLRKKWGLDIQARHREAFQTAVTNAAGLLLQKAGDALPDLRFGSTAMTAAVDFVLERVPDALKKFGLSDEKIAESILSKLPQIAPPVTVVSPATGGALNEADRNLRD